ncbi:uncharacterized protein isoform X2 [Leptinotarsa decemlineata]|uniref:uncharacterized protein isoform X2 n=1 Tax=Leptinotarsa decemlineata TaxID=7539 RepID=UPI003D309DA1
MDQNLEMHTNINEIKIKHEDSEWDKMAEGRNFSISGKDLYKDFKVEIIKQEIENSEIEPLDVFTCEFSVHNKVERNSKEGLLEMKSRILLLEQSCQRYPLRVASVPQVISLWPVIAMCQKQAVPRQARKC